MFLTVLVLGTDRVEQMTKTYNDIDMVTHLLAEVGTRFNSLVQKIKTWRSFVNCQIYISVMKVCDLCYYV